MDEDQKVGSPVTFLVILTFIASYLPPYVRDPIISIGLTTAITILYFVISAVRPPKDLQGKVFIYLISLQIGIFAFAIYSDIVPSVWPAYAIIGFITIAVIWAIHVKVYELDMGIVLFYAIFHIFNFVSGVFRVYIDYPWWDVITHFLGAFLLTLLIFVVFKNRRVFRSRDPRVAAAFALIVAAFIASVVEILEWFGNALNTDVTLTWTDTVWDLVFNNLGALTGAYYSLWLDEKPGK